MRSKLPALLALLALALPVQAAEWPQFHADEKHTGVLACSPPCDFAPPTVRWWSVSTGGPVEGSPVVSDGRVFVGSTDGKLYAFDAISGSPLWAYDTASPISGTPALSGGVLYVVNNGGQLFAIDAVTGALSKSVGNSGRGNPDPGATRSSPSIHQGRLYIGTEGGSLIAYNLQTLVPDWTYRPSEEQVSVASGSTQTGTGPNVTYHPVYSCQSGVYASKPIQTSPAVFQNKVFFGSDVHNLFALDEFGLGQSGAGRTRGAWRLNTSDTAMANPEYGRSGDACLQSLAPPAGDVIRSSPVIDDGLAGGAAQYDPLVIVASYDNVVRAYDLRSGYVFKAGNNYSAAEDAPCARVDSLNLTDNCRPVWEYRNVTDAGGRDSRIISTPAVVDGKVFFGSFNGRFYGLQTYKDPSGVRRVRELWAPFQTGGAIWSSPAVSNGLVAFGSDDQNIYVLDAGTGQEKWHARTGDNVRSSPAIWTGGVRDAPITGGVVYVGARDGILYAFGAQKPALPDLLVADIAYPQPLLVNAEGVVNVTVRNAGNASSPPTNLTLYIDGTLAATLPVAQLAPNETAYATYAWRVPAGNHSIAARVDPGGLAREFDRGNNALKVETPAASSPPPPPPPPKPASANTTDQKGAPGFAALPAALGVAAAAAVLRRRRG